MNFFGDEISQIFVCIEPVDLRKGIDGYAAIVQSVFHRSPMDHCLYIFCNRAHNKIKALYYDKASTGFWLLYKRLEKGAFKWKISKLSEWEGRLRDAKAEPEFIKKVRETKELPILNEIHAKLLELEGDLMPSGKFSAAVNYGLNQWEKLIYYISHQECPMTNNLIEREGVKPFVMARKNVLFANSIEGAESMMIWFSLITSAKMNKLNVEKYISYVLSELSTHKMTDETIERLLPYSDKLPDFLKISNDCQDKQ